MNNRETKIDYRSKTYRVMFSQSGRPIVVALCRANGNELSIDPKSATGRVAVQFARNKLNVADPDKKSSGRWE